MRPDPLDALARLRHFAVDEARRALAECLHAEVAADQAAVTLATRIERETEAAIDLATSDADVEAFAAWLRRIRPEQEAVHLAQDAAEMATTQSRAVVAAACAAADAVDEMVQHRDAERRAAAEHMAQRAIDEVAGQRSANLRKAGGNDTGSCAE